MIAQSDLFVGGANVPALNELLEPYGVAFGDMVLEGQLGPLAGDSPWYASGANIVKWPAAGWLHSAVLADKASQGESISQCMVCSLSAGQTTTKV